MWMSAKNECVSLQIWIICAPLLQLWHDADTHVYICPWVNTIPHKMTMQTLDAASVPSDIRGSVRATTKNKIVDQHYCAFVLVSTSFLVTDSPLLCC